jgi:hypothetical protein
VIQNEPLAEAPMMMALGLFSRLGGRVAALRHLKIMFLTLSRWILKGGTLGFVSVVGSPEIQRLLESV